MNRVRRIAWPLFVLVALLFSQWATASYVCAMLQPPAAQASAHGPGGCPDADTPNTCEQHCFGGHAATDSGKVASIPDVMAFSPLRIEPAPRPLLRASLHTRRDVPPDPPPTIRFSVLRI